MLRFTRHVAGELIKVFLMALTGLTLLLIVVGVLKEAATQGLGPTETLRLIPFLLPDMMRYTLPATCLFTVCIVYGRMSSANEIVALKSLGISPLVVLYPAFVGSFLLSLGTVWLNDVAVTWGQGGVQKVIIEAVEEVIYGVLRTQKSYANKRLSITVKGVEGRTLIRPLFTFQARGSVPPMTVMALEAELTSNPDSNLLKIVCRDVTIDLEDGFSYKTDTFEQELPLNDASRRGDNSYLPARMPMWIIPRRIDEVRLEISSYQQQLAARAASQMLTGELDSLFVGDWETHTRNLGYQWNHLNRLLTEPPRRWANGFSCLCFALVGATLAIRLRHADFMTVFGLCFLPILIAYYPLLAYGVDSAKSGTWHPWIVWLGNVILALWGSWLLRRVWRY